MLAAWLPICRPYLRVADDFHFATWLLTGGVPLYFHEHGVWRILGHEIGNSVTLVHPLLPGVLSIATHAAGATFFLLAARRVTGSQGMALLLALLFAVYPWGDTALLWACEYTYLLSTTFFLAVLCGVLRAFPIAPFWNLVLCILCATVSLLSHEALFFALLVSGGFAFLDRAPLPLRQRLPLAAAPAAGCCIWAILYHIFPGRIPLEHVRLNPRTLLSGIYYQYTNLEVFEPWRSGSTRALMFYGWGVWQWVAAAVLLCALLPALRRAAGVEGRRPERDYRLLLFLCVLLVGAVAIYAIGGGFSLDSRKKYPIIPALLLLGGYGAEQIFPWIRVRALALLAVALCGIATTWLQLGLWRYETERLALLVDFLSTQPRPAAVRVQWDSRIQAAWPHANQFWGAPVEPWVLANALELRALQGPPAPKAAPVAAVRFDPVGFRWQPAD